MARKLFSIERGPEDEIIFSFQQPELNFTLKAREHFRTASKETLLAFRSLIDDAISAVESKEEKKSQKRRTKIEVE